LLENINQKRPRIQETFSWIRGFCVPTWNKKSPGKTPGSDNGGKALEAGDDGVVVSAGAMDDEQSSILVPSAHDPHANI